MVPERDLLDAWSREHGGYDADRSVLVRGWLAAMNRLARPLARRHVAPDLLSGLGVASAVAAVVAPGRRLAAGLVMATAVLDGLDGAVARQRGLASARGGHVDRLADRVTDVLFATALARAGCPRRLAVGAGAATLAFEAQRDVARWSGRRGIGTVTVAERPIRVATVTLALAFAPAAGGAVVVAQCVVGAAQLVMSPPTVVVDAAR